MFFSKMVTFSIKRRTSTSISSDDSPVQESVSKTTSVSGHKRRLSEGKHPSPKKLAEAEDLGILLSDNETLVDPHYRKCA